METGSSSVLSAGSSSFSSSSQVRKNSSSFSCFSVTIFMDSVKKVFFIKYFTNHIQAICGRGGTVIVYEFTPPVALWVLNGFRNMFFF